MTRHPNLQAIPLRPRIADDGRVVLDGALDESGESGGDTSTIEYARYVRHEVATPFDFAALRSG